MVEEIYWNVDTQQDFMNPGGRLPVEGAQEIVGNLEKITQHARKIRRKVVNTGDWHNKKSKEISDEPDYKTTYPLHCMQDTPGADYIKETRPTNPYIIDWQALTLDEKALAAHTGDIVIRKDEFDVFAGNPHTERVLDILAPRRVVVYGVATNKCVDDAVMGLTRREGLEVYVVTDAIKELSKSPVEPILKKWKELGVNLITTDQLISRQYIQ